MRTSPHSGPQDASDKNVVEFPNGSSRANSRRFEDVRDWLVFRVTSDRELNATELRLGVVLAMHINRGLYDKHGIAVAFPGERRLARLTGWDRRNLNHNLDGRDDRPNRLLCHLKKIPREKGSGRKTTHYEFDLSASLSTPLSEPAMACGDTPLEDPSNGVRGHAFNGVRGHAEPLNTPDITPDEPAMTDLGAPSGARPGSSRVSVGSNGVAYAPPEKTNSDHPNNSAGPTHNHAAPYENPLEPREPSPAHPSVGFPPAAALGAQERPEIDEAAQTVAYIDALIAESNRMAAETGPTVQAADCADVFHAAPPPPYRAAPETRPAASGGTSDRQPVAQPTAPDPWAGMTGDQIHAAQVARGREKWFAKRAEWGAEAQENGYACREVRVTCDAGEESCGLPFAAEAIWPDWESKRDHQNEKNDLARMRCPYCGNRGTAVLSSRSLCEEEWYGNLPLAPSYVDDVTPRRMYTQRDQHAPAAARKIEGSVITREKPNPSDDYETADYASLCGGGILP